MNWKRPGETSVALPITGQLLTGRSGANAASTLKCVPGVLAKESWNAPLVSMVMSEILGGVGAEEVTLIILLRLGMPLTKTVAIAQPGGKPVMGAEVNVVAEKLLEVSVTVHPLSRLRSWTIG